MRIIFKYMPVTRTGHIIKATTEKITHYLRGFFQEIALRYGLPDSISVHERYDIAVDLETALGFLNPLTEGKQANRILILDTVERGWSILYLNDTMSGGRWELAIPVTRDLKTESVFFKLQKHTLRRIKPEGWAGKPGAIQFVKLQDGEKKRSIEIVNDEGRWTFYEQGEPFSFEDIRRYKIREKRNRFTPEMLLEYLSFLGFYPFDDNFFKVNTNHPAHGVELVIHDPALREQFKPISLEKLRQQWGPYEEF